MDLSEFDTIVNNFKISGNAKVKKFITKLNQEFIKGSDKEASTDLLFRKIIDKHLPDIAKHSSNDDGSKKINYMYLQSGELAESSINFISKEEINELQDRLLFNLAKLDPNVLVCNQHFDYYLSGDCHARYVLMHDSEFAEVSMSTPIPKSANQNVKFLIKFNQILLKNRKKAFELTKKTYARITEDMFI